MEKSPGGEASSGALNTTRKFGTIARYTCIE